MALSVRPKVYSLPSYSLTGDLLGFLRCGLQYRYTHIGRLPPSRPVQLWFGEFIHGVLEEAFRRYRDSEIQGRPSLPPWPIAEIDDICELIKKRLAARGLFSWDPNLEKLGHIRAETAIQELGPHLFPLIHRAEIRLYGARMLPKIPVKYQFREADRYEMVGVIDVVTHVELSKPKFQKNPLVHEVLKALPGNPGNKFEVIVDYKGMRRPAGKHGGHGSLWDQYAWQLQTYGQLRRRQADALPVVAGVLFYVNELYPTREDLQDLKQEIANKTTDVPPVLGSEAEKMLKSWKIRDPLPDLPFDYRLARAFRVVSIDDHSIELALKEFDKVVQDIETCRGREVNGTTVLSAWDRNSTDEGTCVVCDSRTFCPDYRSQYAKNRGEFTPRIPGVRSRHE
jgi:hypothetical protein